jgi:hypothetical protein
MRVYIVILAKDLDNYTLAVAKNQLDRRGLYAF